MDNRWRVMMQGKLLVLGLMAALTNGCSDNLVDCLPQCEGRSCGSNGCGGSCGICAGGYYCAEGGQCAVESSCGDGSCSATYGESCDTCLVDCPCETGEACQQGRCVASLCGDGACDPLAAEGCHTCPADCACPDGQICEAGVCVEVTSCGDGACDPLLGENCHTCSADCACPDGQICEAGVCVEATSCGDGACDPLLGENCHTCVADCACGAGETCSQGVCLAGTSCGDGACQAPETCLDCVADCGCSPGFACIQGSCLEYTACGNGTCEGTESCSSCPGDCGLCCGNGLCEAALGENCSTCLEDCSCPEGQHCQEGSCRAAGCGDGSCGADEGCSTCPHDCGPCCGNGVCEPEWNEGCVSCLLDCPCLEGEECQHGVCAKVVLCPNGVCDEGEGCETCEADCGLCCGNGACEAIRGEDCDSCLLDCGCPEGQACLGGACEAITTCPSGACEPEEDCASCPADCGSCCGNGACEADRGETCATCEADCACQGGLACESALCRMPSRLYLPFVITGIAGWSSTVSLQNLGPGATDILAEYYGENNGTVLATQEATVPSFSVVTLDQADLALESETFWGSAVIRATQPLAAVANLTDGTRRASYTAPRQGETTLYLPLIIYDYDFTSTQKLCTDVEVQNTGDSLAEVTLRYTAVGETEALAEESFVLPPQSMHTFFHDMLPSGFLGAAVLTSDQPVAAVVAQNWTEGSSFVDMTFYTAAGAGATTLYLPLVMVGDSGDQTSMFVQNGGSESTHFDVTYYREGSSTPEQTATHAVDAGSVAMHFHGTNLPPGFVGCAVVTSKEPLIIMVHQMVVSTDSYYSLSSYMAQPQGSIHLASPLVVNGDWVTTASLQNTSDQPSSVTVQYYLPQSSALVDMEVVDLPPHGCRNLADSNAGLPQGSAILVGTQPFVTAVTQKGVLSGKLSSYEGVGFTP